MDEGGVGRKGCCQDLLLVGIKDKGGEEKERKSLACSLSPCVNGEVTGRWAKWGRVAVMLRVSIKFYTVCL